MSFEYGLIRVAIIADNLLRARTLATLLAEDEHLEIVEARTVSRDLALSRSRMADVIVFAGLRRDAMPVDGGPPIVVLTEAPQEEITLGPAIRAWLPLHSSAAEISAAIVAAANNLVILTQDQARRSLRGSDPTHDDADFPSERLTSRESQVLRMLADGLANREIAAQLRISDHTAKFHVAQILAKLGAGSRTQAVTIGIRRGLIPV